MRLKRWRFVSVVAAIVGLLLSSGVQGTAGDSAMGADTSSPEEFRTWSDRSGNFHADAALVDVKDGVVTITKKDGTTVNVSLERLSDADRQYVEAFATGARGEDRTSPGSEPDESSARGGETAVGDDENVRTEARGDTPVQPKVRTSYRTTARTAARTIVGSYGTQGTRRVTVDGVGTTADEALKDCFRKAVAVVMGSIVDTETQVENDQLVVDRILTLSDGFVDSFEELGKAYVEDGLVHRHIIATVRRDSLLVACGRAESVSVDASGLYPEVMTKLERRRNAVALLRKTLDMLPGSVLRVQVGTPRVEKLGETRTTLGIELVIRADSQKYEAFQDRMTNILRCLSRQEGTIEATGNPMDQISDSTQQQLLRQKFLDAAMRDPEDMSVIDAEFVDVKTFWTTAITVLTRGG